MKSLNTCRSVSWAWNEMIRDLTRRKFLRLEDLVILPPMSHEYKKQHMGGTLDWWEEDELEEMATELVCYHVEGFKDKKPEKVVTAKVQILPQWRMKTRLQLMRGKVKSELESYINLSLR